MPLQLILVLPHVIVGAVIISLVVGVYFWYKDHKASKRNVV